MAYKGEYAKEKFRPKRGRLLDQVREVMRYHHYAIRTEQTYVKWILDYIRFNGARHPREMRKWGCWFQRDLNIFLYLSQLIKNC